MNNVLGQEEKIAWIQLLRTENIGPVHFYKLIQKFGSAQKALEHLPEIVKKIKAKKSFRICSKQEAEKEYEKTKKAGVQLIAFCEEKYPFLLKKISDPPPLLYVKGSCDLFYQKTISIVGARNASINGKQFARHLARDLAQHDFTIISGLARGIDTAAHEGTLKAEGKTAAVLAGSVDHIYPPENNILYEKILDLNGCILSEMPMGTMPQAHHFPRRNRIISGLSLAVIVIEATLKSGSLITARFALEQGRDVLAVPGFPLDPRAQGPNKLIKNGAHVIESVNDVLNALEEYEKSFQDPMPEMLWEETSSKVFSEDEEENLRIFIQETLSSTPVDIDELIQESQTSRALFSNILLEFELAGQIEHHPGNKISKIYEENL